MPSGEALIAETSTVDALLARHWSHRRPVPTGLFALLTMFFWAGWLYLVLPLVSLLLWAFGVRLFMEQIRQGGYEGLLAYSTVLLVIVSLLALWIAWNVVRYGGDSDRRTVKREEVPDWVVRGAFRLEDSLLTVLRDKRLVRVDFDGDGVVVIADARSHEVSPAAAAVQDGPAVLQGDRDRMRSG